MRRWHVMWLGILAIVTVMMLLLGAGGVGFYIAIMDELNEWPLSPCEYPGEELKWDMKAMAYLNVAGVGFYVIANELNDRLVSPSEHYPLNLWGNWNKKRRLMLLSLSMLCICFSLIIMKLSFPAGWR